MAFPKESDICKESYAPVYIVHAISMLLDYTGASLAPEIFMDFRCGCILY